MGKQQECDCPKIDPGAPKWVVTFGDLMSLLLCFFVLLLSFSELDRQKYKQVAGSMEKAFGIQRKVKVMDVPKGMKMIAKDFDQEIVSTRIQEAIGREIEDLLDTQLSDMKDQIDVDATEENVTIRLMGESTFDSGNAVIRRRMKPLLDKVANIIANSKNDIIIAGHTDNVPIRGGPFRTNLRLSAARASAVAEYMLSVSGIDPRRLSTMGFGQHRPIATNQTAAGREKNRRVEIILGSMPKADRYEDY